MKINIALGSEFEYDGDLYVVLGEANDSWAYWCRNKRTDRIKNFDPKIIHWSRRNR